MPKSYKRKADDNVVVALNNVGLSLGTIAKMLDVHHTTITYRLKALGITPADTRRAFMEDIYASLSPKQQEWLLEQLGPGRSAKDLIRSCIIEKYINRSSAVDKDLL